MKFRRLITSMLSVLTIVSAADFTFAIQDFPIGTAKQTQTDDPEVVQIKATLNTLTPWTKIKLDDSVRIEDWLLTLEKLALNETNLLRAAIVDLVAADQSVDLSSKIFVLNRFIFDVPSSLPIEDARFFGGWRGVPLTKKDVNAFWPLGINQQQKVVLVGAFRGYFGEDFQAVREFDFMDRRFGRRKVAKNK